MTLHSPLLSKGVTGCALVLGFMLGASVEASAITVRQPLINDKIDETQLVTLPGNVRPEANASHDRGPVADSMPLNHLQLVLGRDQFGHLRLGQVVYSRDALG